MEINPVVGFASIKVVTKGGKFVSKPTYLHRLPVGESEDSIDINKIENELLTGLRKVVEQHPPTEYESNFGYYLEYTKASYPK